MANAVDALRKFQSGQTLTDEERKLLGLGTITPKSTTDTNTSSSLAAAWGLSKALMNDPIYGEEIRKIFAFLDAGDYASADKALKESKFYQNNGSVVASRLKLKYDQPGAYAEAENQYIINQKYRLRQLGVKISENTLTEILKKAYASNYNDKQVDLAVINSGAMESSMGGSTRGTIESLKAYADSFGIEYSDAAWDKYSKDVFAGNITSEDIQLKIRQDAASTYPAYGEAILKGTSLEAIASAYKTSMANILEIDPDSLKWTEPKLRQALQYVGPDGKPATMPIWKFEQELRNDPRWEYTDNARNTIDSMSLKVLRDWGLA